MRLIIFSTLYYYNYYPSAAIADSITLVDTLSSYACMLVSGSHIPEGHSQE